MAAVLQRDAWLAFRVLCRLSMRTADSAAGMDPPALRGKVSTPHLQQLSCQTGQIMADAHDICHHNGLTLSLPHLLCVVEWSLR